MNRTMILEKRYNRLLTAIKFSAPAAGAFFIGLSAALYWFYKNLTPDDLGPDWLAMATAVAILALGLYHLIALLALWVSARAADKPNIVRSFSIAVGCVSAVSLAASAVALSDIGHQTEAGLASTGEWTILLINLIITLLFIISSLLVLPVYKIKPIAPFIINDDMLFITTNEVGLLSSLMAVCAIVLGLIYPILEAYREAVIVIYTTISLAPWGLMLLGWFLSRRKKISKWWDEKQMLDMGRASFISLIATVATAIVIYIAGHLFLGFAAAMLWFPAVVVISVLSFSALNTAFARWG